MNQTRRSGVVHLACPVCAEPLSDAGSAAVCGRGHAFDFARQGHLNLVVGRPSGRVGDTAEMVRARAAVHARGVFEPLAEALRASIAGFSRPGPTKPCARRGLVAEIGSGTGYYLAAAAEAAGAGCAIGVDLSKAAAAHAARAHPEMLFVVADVQERIPLRTATADVLISAFSPRPAGEAARVTKPNGLLLIAMATEAHLQRTRTDHDLMDVHPGKPDQLRERLAADFDELSADHLEWDVEVTPDLIAMGPNARPVGNGTDRASVDLLTFRRRIRQSG
jgi:23S rRNA (guanine745-N1)-methyltransferase